MELTAYIETLQQTLGKTAQINFLPLQDGDVPATNANVDALHAITGFAPATTVKQGIGNFVSWYRNYYGA